MWQKYNNSAEFKTNGTPGATGDYLQQGAPKTSYGSATQVLDNKAKLIDSIWTLILLPVLKPALATVGLFCIVGHWNSWFDGIIYMNNPAKYPLQSYLQTLLQSFEQIMQKSGTDYAKLLSMMNARTGRAAQLFLGAVPIMLIYPFLQKYFTKGLVLGSVKG